MDDDDDDDDDSVWFPSIAVVAAGFAVVGAIGLRARARSEDQDERTLLLGSYKIRSAVLTRRCCW